ncbi:probable CCR4-associated factor 1 homolog 9 [Lathyrus oleraceus]|uniref:probable CCR4-associated factor 1 homolog 9 n=1 Tax=Pisum sativum TaxID=3888 RepID=UPI0021D1242D|nr:probable CCR4-associated factor 1 homolog 9 [Pisum sativum]
MTEKNFCNGMDSMHFAELIFLSGLVFNKTLMWITFSCAYDFGYLVKILNQKNLLNCLEDFLNNLNWLEDFLNNVEVLFGKNVIDMKHMMKCCLERVATTLNVSRVVGKSHQAESDSLLISQTFRKMIETCIINKKVLDLKDYAGVLFGLEILV